jgi:hypothetical protein
MWLLSWPFLCHVSILHAVVAASLLCVQMAQNMSEVVFAVFRAIWTHDKESGHGSRQ